MSKQKFWYRPAYNLTEKEVRYAIAATHSNREAAAFLHINMNTWKIYASKYFDHETGKNLYEIHKNKSRRGTTKPHNILKVPFEDIFAGKHPGYNTTRLRRRLIEENIFPESCNICGFSERRVSDYTVPLILTWKNGNKKDHSFENLELVCYNCYHLNYGNMHPGAYIIVER